jgi:hypothetical protein
MEVYFLVSSLFISHAFSPPLFILLLFLSLSF